MAEFYLNQPLSSFFNEIDTVPTQLMDAAPYILTVVILAGFVGKAIPPRAGGAGRAVLEALRQIFGVFRLPVPFLHSPKSNCIEMPCVCHFTT